MAEDHQTKNAMALVNKDAASLVKDSEAHEKLIRCVVELVNDISKQVNLKNNISKMAFHNSADVIAREVLKLASYKL
jgi:UDP-N-acetylglucosamine--N-acetylmuramyl-(pentapeptide) pyrophosphoryl-undecaprenol N-acetylglucosamine transferase